MFSIPNHAFILQRPHHHQKALSSNASPFPAINLTPIHQFAQELLQTFSTTIGSISLVPVTGGIFTVTILHAPPLHPSNTSLISSSSSTTEAIETLLWDRKTEGGFPETKELKNRVRNIIDPGRDMGHIDRRLKRDMEDKAKEGEEDGSSTTQSQTSKSTSASTALSIEPVGTSTVPLSREEVLQKLPEGCDDCK
jgi:predicted Rdx family selenoprotein